MELFPTVFLQPFGPTVENLGDSSRAEEKTTPLEVSSSVLVGHGQEKKGEKYRKKIGRFSGSKLFERITTNDGDGDWERFSFLCSLPEGGAGREKGGEKKGVKAQKRIDTTRV